LVRVWVVGSWENAIAVGKCGGAIAFWIGGVISFKQRENG
jgi:hypothetical protein